jgi:hypothetical protein
MRMPLHRETRPGMTALLLCLLPLVSSAATIEFRQQSEPLGFYDELDVIESGVTVDTVDAAMSTSGYHFTRWSLNGVYQTDLLGRGINPVSLLILVSTTATAHYTPSSLDADADSIPDWYELHMNGDTNAAATSDADADGFDLAEEYRRDYHPNLTNELADGGFSLVLAPASRMILNSDYSTYLEQTDPLGIYATVDQVLTNGTQIDAPARYGASGGYSFTHWDLNGASQTDVLGRAVSFFGFTLASNSVSTAHHVPSGQDSDADGLSDWLELNYFGSTNVMPTSDADGDGFDLAEELRRDYHPNVTNEIADGGFSLVLAPSARVIVDTNLVVYEKRSDPEGVLTTTEEIIPRGTTNTIANTYGASGGYSFTHWTLNDAAQTDVVGRALSHFEFVIQSNTTAEANYVPSGQDGDGDGLADWLELNYFGTTNVAASSDADGDGFDLAEELRRDYHPSITNEIADGGFSLVLAPPSRVIGNTNFVTYLEWSDPEGVFATSDEVIEKGTQIDVPARYGASGGYSFTHWDLNGVRQEDVAGRAVSFFDFTLESNSVSTARYVPTGQDSDGDGLGDWLELNYFGSTNVTPASDADTDGFDLAEELRRDYHPNVRNEIVDGGFSLVMSTPVTVNLQYFPRVSQSLMDGVSRDLFLTLSNTNNSPFASSNAYPALGDWDGDLDLDLFVGGAGGELRIFENGGSPQVLNLVERTTNFADIASAWTNLTQVCPALGDWSGDGVADLAIGGSTNVIALIQSSGDWSSPSLQSTVHCPPSTLLTSPAFGDVNADGWQDLLVLTEAGTIVAYTNTRSSLLPFTDPVFSSNLLGTAVQNATGLTTADVNDDGVLDVLVSDDAGSIWEFHGE